MQSKRGELVPVSLIARIGMETEFPPFPKR